jgi:VanZ family protein
LPIDRKKFEVMATRLARLSLVTLGLAITVLSLVPGSARPHTGAPGKVEHFIVYAIAGLALAAGYRTCRSRVLGWLVFAGASALFEVLQCFIADRSASPLDALVSTAGLTFGVAAGVAALPIIIAAAPCEKSPN